MAWCGAAVRNAARLRDLVAAGKIRSFGVSNFDIKDMAEWLTLDGASSTQVNQVMYNVRDRGIDFDSYPGAGSGIAIMAYSPWLKGRYGLRRRWSARGQAP